jgi:hypothetical protein
MPPSATLSDSCAAKWFRYKVGRLSLQAGVRRRVHAVDWHAGLFNRPGGALGGHGRDADGAGLDATKACHRRRSGLAEI